MLITSRGTGRWVIPKGNPIKGLAPHEAAAREALEEAGVIGLPCSIAIGEYRYSKRRGNGPRCDMTVAVFPLAFTAQLEDWLEQDERDTRWFDLAGAAAAVDEPDLRRLIAAFRPPPATSNAASRFQRAVGAAAGRQLPILRSFGFLMLAAALLGALFYAVTRLAN